MNTKNTKKRFVLSLVVTIVSIAMLVGATFAWFTDSVTSGKNKIVAGDLDVELYHQSKGKAKEKVTEATDYLFKDVELWEPGAYVYETFTVSNVGTLALKYKMALDVAEYSSYEGHNLTEVLKVVALENVPETREDITGGEPLSTWSLNKGKTLNPNEEETFTVAIYWEPTDHDNDFNMNNGKPQPLYVDLGVQLIATQAAVESDSFDNQYDKDAPLQLEEKEKVETKMARATAKAGEKTEFNIDIAPAIDKKETKVTFEEDALASGEYYLVCSTQNKLFTVKSSEQTAASIDLKLYDKDNNLVSSFADGKKVTIKTYVTKNLIDVNVVYNGTGTNPTSVSYNSETGELTFETDHFSEYLVKSSSEAYIKTKDVAYNTFDDAFSAALTDDTIVLFKDVALTKTYNISGKILAIDGAGHKFIRANGFADCFFTVSSSATFSLLNATLDGEAIWSGDVNKYLQRGTENTGKATASPAIEIKSGVLNCNKVNFQNLDATTASGAAIYCNAVGQHMNVTNCTFINNSCAGGTIWYRGYLDVKDSTFIGNDHDSCGVIRATSNSVFSSFKNCEFTNNEGGVGAVFYIYGSTTNPFVVEDCKCNNNHSTGPGGVVYTYDSVADFKNTELCNNSAEEAGGVLGSGSNTTGRNITFTGCKLNGNKANEMGGVFRQATRNNVVLDGCEVKNNVDDSFAVTYAWDATLTIKGETAISNNISKNGYGIGIYGGLDFTIGKATISDRITTYLTGTPTITLLEDFASINVNIETGGKDITAYKFKPNYEYTYSPSDIAKINVLNDGYHVQWNDANKAFVIVTN